jgi:hypothetical protein
MAERALTAGERQIVTSIFGSNIDLDAISITTDRATIGQNVPITPFGRIHWPADLEQYPG